MGSGDDLLDGNLDSPGSRKILEKLGRHNVRYRRNGSVCSISCAQMAESIELD